MAHAIAAPLEHLEFVVQPLDKATRMACDEVVRDAVEPSVELIEAEFQTPFAACFHLYFTVEKFSSWYVCYVSPNTKRSAHEKLFMI